MADETIPRREVEPADLTLYFQPIVDFGGEILRVNAVEALSRGPAGGKFERAAPLFDHIRVRSDEVRFDRHCLARALAAASGLSETLRLHVNVHVTTLERDPAFAAHVETAAAAVKFDTARLTIELVEQSTYFNAERLLESVHQLRHLGVAFAVDNAGIGNCNERLIVDVVPEYLKIDRYFVAGCANDRYRRSMIRSVIQIGRDDGAIVIAEGIENESDLDALRELGVRFGQGYLFGRPAAPLEWSGLAQPWCATHDSSPKE